MLSAIYEAMKKDCNLFKAKVKEIIVMGNPYKQNDFNFSMDAKSTKGFFEICPCPVYISYLGSDIITGNLLTQSKKPSHPVRKAYEIWTSGKGRSSWDLIATLFALNKKRALFNVSGGCLLSYNEIEKTTTISKNGTRDKILTLNCTNKEMEDLLNKMLSATFD